jgi:hypothetical protein
MASAVSEQLCKPPGISLIRKRAGGGVGGVTKQLGWIGQVKVRPRGLGHSGETFVDNPQFQNLENSQTLC